MLAGAMLAVEDGVNKARRGGGRTHCQLSRKWSKAWRRGRESGRERGREQCLPGKESKTMLGGGEGGRGNG